MAIYERLREEANDAKRGKKKRSAPRPERWSWKELSKIRKNRAWRYYRAVARSRKAKINEMKEECNDDTKTEARMAGFPDRRGDH